MSPSQIIVTTQDEMDAVPPGYDGLIIIKGNVRVVLRESSAPRIVARDTSAPRIEAWDTSAPRIVAYGASAPSGTGGANAIVAVHYSTPRVPDISGPHVILVPIPAIATAGEWCAYHGVAVADGVAMVYKAVRDDFKSAHGCLYAPGAPSVECQDWDGGDAECGGGLHFSPTPGHAKEFDNEATRYVACPVALADMRPPKPGDDCPQKIKARRVCGLIYEVDRDGQRMEQKGGSQ